MTNTAEALPTDLAAAHAMILAERAARLSAESDRRSLDIEIERLKLEIARLRRERYGQSAGDVIAADWAEGFMQAVALRPAAWKPLLKSEKNVELILPILALCCDDDGEPLLDLPHDVEDRLFAEAGDLIPECVLAIADYWRTAPTAPMRQSLGSKIGRNDPCPCGSGKKFKKCCGAN